MPCTSTKPLLKSRIKPVWQILRSIFVLDPCKLFQKRSFCTKCPALGLCLRWVVSSTHELHPYTIIRALYTHSTLLKPRSVEFFFSSEEKRNRLTYSSSNFCSLHLRVLAKSACFAQMQALTITWIASIYIVPWSALNARVGQRSRDPLHHRCAIGRREHRVVELEQRCEKGRLVVFA